MRPIAMATSSGGANGAGGAHVGAGLAPPIVSAEEFHRRAAANVHARARDAHAAFYSSWTDCITTDPAAMVLPMDDHMAHRGHGVFDTAHLHAGHLHMLDRHVARFFKSMRAANIPPPFDRETVTALVLRVAAAGGLREGQLRFYASAGPGGFALDQAECVKSVFYCVAVKKRAKDASKDASCAPLEALGKQVQRWRDAQEPSTVLLADVAATLFCWLVFGVFFFRRFSHGGHFTWAYSFLSLIHI